MLRVVWLLLRPVTIWSDGRRRDGFFWVKFRRAVENTVTIERRMTEKPSRRRKNFFLLDGFGKSVEQKARRRDGATAFSFGYVIPMKANFIRTKAYFDILNMNEIVS